MAEQDIDFFPDEQAGAIKVQAKLDHHTTMLSSLVRIGRIVTATATDPQQPDDIPRVLVQVGGNNEGSYIRNWMPWTTARAGYDAEWWMPETDEQVLVVAPSGNLSQGIIIGTLFRGALTFDSAGNTITAQAPLPDLDQAQATIHKRIYQDGSSISYDRNQHIFALSTKQSRSATEQTAITLKANQDIVISAGSSEIRLQQNGDINIIAKGSTISIEGDVTVKGALDVS
ncbi:MAG: phage baseplate assembly protein V [Pseudomonadota bacterium]